MCCKLRMRALQIFEVESLVHVVFTLSGDRSLKTLMQTLKFRLFQSELWQTTIFEFDEIGRNFCKSVENTVGRGAFFLQCFQKTCTAHT